MKLTQYGAIMLNLDQNLGAYGLPGGEPVCASLREGTPEVPSEPSGWGELLFNGSPDCEPGYLPATMDLFAEVYEEAGVIDRSGIASEGISSTILEALDTAVYRDNYDSNAWIGRLGP